VEKQQEKCGEIIGGLGGGGGAPYKVLLLKEKLTEIYFAAGHQEKPKGPGATVVGPVN